MADQNLKDFAVNWILFGLLFFCLLSFAITFMYYNNPSGLGDVQTKLGDAQTNVLGKLVVLPEDSDALLNVTSNLDPEASFLGSRDSVATSYGVTGSSRGFFDSIKIFVGWVFTGDTGETILLVFGGLFGFLALYFVTKWIRNGW